MPLNTFGIRGRNQTCTARGKKPNVNLAYLLVTCSFICLMRSTLATTVEPINLFEMVNSADRIFWGECLSSESEQDLFPGQVVTT